MRLQLRPPGLGQPWRHRPALLAVPFGLVVAITVLDLLTGENIQLGPLLVVAPALAAMIGGVRLTALAGALAVGAQITLSALLGGVTTANHQAQIVALFLVALFVVAFRAVHERHEQALHKARWVADVAQKVLLRPLPDRIGALRIASVYVAAEAEAQIGGDLYAVAPGRYGTRFLIGDVRGKGLSAVGDAALLLGAFRAAAHRNPPLPRLVAHLHNAVHWDTVEPTGAPDYGEGFVTAAILEVPADEQLLRLISCGHPPPLLLRDGKVTFLTVGDPALPLGVGGERSEEDYAPEPFSYRGGDVLLLYTDGVVEARDSHGAFYDLAGNVAAWHETEPERLVRLIHESLLAHAGGSLGDDAAFVAVERLA
ncbi:protein phosphatase [Streptomyces eurocidicus]|uniref:Protein phosphatase n=1 Tax=Streptomyces eurocidicus TaxID=66423 RepID=A0A2N8NTN4_STREU|nr:PP2C family protein-serine/threonine phosphatase [Streptomyces eurocidicus]MBB5119426.1 serine phosphatase RsbU (regulator of sigma subunit) [Streptomyces eurocidicus]MBF6052995.1 SpoIIE family protein phosphatase [Streptomyces eurocidicus]PNE32130.1 protein phosphatase [Streptomyces eurocidicus]